MRAYAFSHFLLMPLQKGLQSNHAICRIRSTNHGFAYVYDNWEKNHTTLIYLNGGFSRNLQEIMDTFLELKINTSDFMFPIPWSEFREDQDTMEGMRTAVACILHPRYYAAIACVRNDKDFWGEIGKFKNDQQLKLSDAMKFEKAQVDPEYFENYTEKEIALINFLSQFSFAC